MVGERITDARRSRGLSIDDVASWIRSEAGQQDLPVLLSALQDTTASAVSAIQPSTDLKKPAWPGYTDLEAEEWCTNIHDCLKHLAAKQGKSLRGVWPAVEAKLIGLELTTEEIDFAWELAVAGEVVTGKQLTEARSLFEGRFDEPCPLTIALKQFGELDGYKPLTKCIEICSLGAVSSSEACAASWKTAGRRLRRCAQHQGWNNCPVFW